ncbi:hypothetical protein [Gemmatimonas sp. UBA7669]|uniref:hypothetical protein n=1 Tax=Gemmatimonas sp. UBA7669 TaxID=1946568 RepID=UPI0025B912E5|nr:hypothetical protein [Gemmatimonas sp. UBA7669]
MKTQTREQVIRTLVDQIWGDERVASNGAQIRPDDWALSVHPSDEVDAMLVACAVGCRLHVSPRVPQGIVMLRQLPPEVR